MANPSGKKIEYNDIVGKPGIYWWLGGKDKIRFKYDGKLPSIFTGIECETLDNTWSVKEIWLSGSFGHYETDDPGISAVSFSRVMINGIKIAVPDRASWFEHIVLPPGLSIDMSKFPNPCKEVNVCHCQNLFAFGHQKGCPHYKG